MKTQIMRIMRICDANLQMKFESTNMRMRKRDKWRFIEINRDKLR